MASATRKSRNSVSLQREMFRLAEHEHGLSLSVIARTREIPYSTLRSWASGETQMPAWALGELDLPDDIVSLVLSPYAKHVGTDEAGEADPDELAEAALDVAGEVQAARSAKSPGGSAIVHIEHERIRKAARKLTPKARAAAA